MTWARGNSNLCVAYAVLLKAFPQREEFSIYKIPRSQLEDHLRRTIRALCLSNKNCSRHKPNQRDLGRTVLAGGLGNHRLCLGGTSVRGPSRRGHAGDGARGGLPRSGQSGQGDPQPPFRQHWRGGLLLEHAAARLAANKYADDPRATRWDTLCKKWAFNGVSIAADADSEEVVDGQPLKDWIVSENLHPDLTLENHAMWSVGYQFSQQHFGEAALAYRAVRPTGSRRHWRITPTRCGERSPARCSFGMATSFIPHGQDWSWKVYSSIEYLCWQNCCRRNRGGGRIESRAVQMIYRRQLALGTGDLGAAVSAVLDFGNQTVKPKRWAFCYLMHEHFDSPGSAPVSRGRQDGSGRACLPLYESGDPSHASRSASASPGTLGIQPIYMLPEGDSTFADPPFFFPYDRDSGGVDVSEPCAASPPNTKTRAIPPTDVMDGDLSTFWISGTGNSRREADRRASGRTGYTSSFRNQ